MSESRQITVVKIGGALLNDDVPLAPLWDAVRDVQASGDVIVVHGGGPQSTAMARRLGHEPRIVEGRRVTTDLDLDILQWTVRGSLNTRLVAEAIARGVRAAGISGVDGATVEVTRRPPWRLHGEEVDFGWVGDVKVVHTALLETLLAGGFVPVVAPVAVDSDGLRYNVNADTVAQSIARALNAKRFLLVTESGGVWRDPNDAASKLDCLDTSAIEDGRSAGWIGGGMLVKVRVAADAAAAGIAEVFIIPPGGIRDPQIGTRVVAT